MPPVKTTPKYWFPARRYGWGWGLPTTWQGWVVLGTFTVLVTAGVFIFPPHESTTAWLVYVGVLSLLLLVVCWLKGEPPRWRWGGDDDRR